MHDVVVHILRAGHQIADELRVGRNAVVQRILDGAHGGQAMHKRADAANALGKGPASRGSRPLRISSMPPHHGAGAVSALDGSGAISFGLDAKVPLLCG